MFILFAPNLKEPPKFVTSSCSGSKSIIGFLASFSISVEFASGKLQTFLANETAANWNPKHIPKYGILFSLAKFAVSIIPSEPRVPNPPGTNIPLYFFSVSILPLRVSESIQSIFTGRFIDAPACFNA